MVVGTWAGRARSPTGRSSGRCSARRSASVSCCSASGRLAPYGWWRCPAAFRSPSSGSVLACQPAAAADRRRRRRADPGRGDEPRLAQRRQRAGRLARRPGDRRRATATAPRSLVGVALAVAGFLVVVASAVVQHSRSRPSHVEAEPGAPDRARRSSPDREQCSPCPPTTEPEVAVQEAASGTARPRVLSGIQPTADSFHFGNYLGALRQWVRPAGGLPAVLLHRRPARDHRRAGPEGAARAHACGPPPSCSRWASTRTGRRSSSRARSRPTPSSAGCSSA